MCKNADPEIKNIIDKYRFAKEIKNYSSKYYPNDNSIFLSIQSKEHVDMAEQCIVNLLKAYSDIMLLPCDIDAFGKALGIYEIAVNKVLQCYSNPDLDFDYTSIQLQYLINKVQLYNSEIKALYQKMLVQSYYTF